MKIAIGTSAGGKNANSPVQIHISGDDLDNLSDAARSFARILGSIEGVRNTSSDLELGYPEVQIIPNRLVAADLGVDSTLLGNTVKNFISGIYTGSLPSGQEEINLQIGVVKDKIDPVDDLEKIIVELKNGTRVPLLISLRLCRPAAGVP